MISSKINSSIFIDDDALTNLFHRRLMEQYKIFDKFQFFSSAKDALHHLKETASEPEKFPDIIFLDIDMPGMNGWEFIEQFSNFELSKYPIIIMLSASKRPEDVTKANLSNLVYKLWNKPLHLDAISKLKNEFVYSI